MDDFKKNKKPSPSAAYKVAYKPNTYGQITKYEAGKLYKAVKGGDVVAKPELVKQLYNETEASRRYASERYSQEWQYYDRVSSMTHALVNEDFKTAQEKINEIEKDMISRAGKKSPWYKYQQEETRPKSATYWRNRQIRQEATAFKSQQEVVETSVKAYNAALSDIDKSINKIFGNFAKTAELSAEDGKQLISEAMQNDIVQDLLKLKSQLTDKRQIKAVDNRINALAYGYRINRAEAVKQSIYVAMKTAGIKEAAAGERCIASAFENGYNGVMQGIGVSFDVLPQRAIDKAIKERWHGKNYSENVWANTSKVADKASGIIQSGLTSGKSIQDMSQELKDMIGDDSEGALYNATRLIRTETGHYMNQGELEAYKDSDLEYYEYLASDPCDECGELDGRRFKVSEAVEGVNYPVMHPNCRCTTIPVVDLDEVLEEMKKGG